MREMQAKRVVYLDRLTQRLSLENEDLRAEALRCEQAEAANGGHSRGHCCDGRVWLAC